jgi:hypothetical protein
MSNLPDLIANHARIVARYGRDIDRRHLPPECAVTVPVERWPEIGELPPLRYVARLRLGVTCRACGADDWTFRRVRRKCGIVSRGRECRPCANERTKAKQKTRRAFRDPTTNPKMTGGRVSGLRDSDDPGTSAGSIRGANGRGATTKAGEKLAERSDG